MKSIVRFVALGALVAAGGCYDSLVGGQCTPGYVVSHGVCVQTADGRTSPLDPDAPMVAMIDAPRGGTPDAGSGTGTPDAGSGTDDGNPDAGTGSGSVDAGGGSGIDAPLASSDAPLASPDAPLASPDAPMPDAPLVADASPDAATCPGIDLQTDPDNCGVCGNVCPSGICSLGACVGTTSGRVVLIGHDFQARHAGNMRLLGNALALGAGTPIKIGYWRGNANPSQVAANMAAIAYAATARSLTWQEVDETTLTDSGVNVVVIFSQGGTADDAIAAGAAWTTALQFVRSGGVVIAFGGEHTVSEHVLSGAGLLDATASSAATGTDLTVTATTDALATGVISPYYADLTTLGYHAGRGVVVVQDPAGDAIAIDAPAP